MGDLLLQLPDLLLFEFLDFPLLPILLLLLCLQLHLCLHLQLSLLLQPSLLLIPLPLHLLLPQLLLIKKRILRRGISTDLTGLIRCHILQRTELTLPLSLNLEFLLLFSFFVLLLLLGFDGFDHIDDGLHGFVFGHDEGF